MNPATPESPGAFVTTQWTRVMLARGESEEARAALAELCEAYYAPVHAFIARSVRNSEAARDLTQEFFQRLLARAGIRDVDPEMGRFRSFLLGAVKHFLADMRAHQNALKRNSGLAPESLAAGTDTSPGIEIADLGAPDPEREFDRKWALTILERSLDALAGEYEK